MGIGTDSYWYVSFEMVPFSFGWLKQNHKVTTTILLWVSSYFGFGGSQRCQKTVTVKKRGGVQGPPWPAAWVPRPGPQRGVPKLVRHAEGDSLGNHWHIHFPLRPNMGTFKPKRVLW